MMTKPREIALPKDEPSLLKLKHRFWAKVDVQGLDDCWIWNGCTNSDGYGCFGIGGRKMRQLVRAHRLVWILEHGQIPDGLCVLHKCDKPGCCNPNHLFIGTNADNTKDASRKGRLRGGSKLTRSDALGIRRLRENGLSLSYCAERFHVSKSHISNVALGRRWKHLRRRE